MLYWHMPLGHRAEPRLAWLLPAQLRIGRHDTAGVTSRAAVDARTALQAPQVVFGQEALAQLNARMGALDSDARKMMRDMGGQQPPE